MLKNKKYISSLNFFCVSNKTHDFKYNLTGEYCFKFDSFECYLKLIK